MDARRPHMVVLRGVGVLLVLLLGSVLALVQPASAAPAVPAPLNMARFHKAVGNRSARGVDKEVPSSAPVSPDGPVLHRQIRDEYIGVVDCKHTLVSMLVTRP